MTYTKEFPDFQTNAMPELPQGFFDQSWHNDTMPSFTNEKLGLKVWIDYAEPERREDPSGKRFALQQVSDDDESEDLLLSDSWPEVLAMIESVRAGIQSKCHHTDTGRGVCADCGTFL